MYKQHKAAAIFGIIMVAASFMITVILDIQILTHIMTRISVLCVVGISLLILGWTLAFIDTLFNFEDCVEKMDFETDKEKEEFVEFARDLDHEGRFTFWGSVYLSPIVVIILYICL